jgi:hypothetical protein
MNKRKRNQIGCALGVWGKRGIENVSFNWLRFCVSILSLKYLQCFRLEWLFDISPRTGFDSQHAFLLHFFFLPPAFFRSNVWLYGSKKKEKKNFKKTFPVSFFHASLECWNESGWEAFQILLCRIECFYDFSDRDKHLISPPVFFSCIFSVGANWSEIRKILRFSFSFLSTFI